ncbi:MAG: hypothetical protein Ct9H90mP16_08420 [Candidatus Poseidoniales archaeon]|nr:MAG: hypothetical protein Ct9H90mP16_08420 [Candidatus Poseidoniales archaeon]
MTELDLSGTALGWLPKGAAITGATIASGDVMIGLPASGVHSNGFSLVRKVVELSGLNYTDPAPFDATHPGRDIVRMGEDVLTLGEVLLNPTRIYVDPVTDLIDACRAGTGPCPADALHGICHVTGGGLSNLLRLHDELGWHIEHPMPVLPEFDWIQSTGDITDREMARTFNLGMGWFSWSTLHTPIRFANGLQAGSKGRKSWVRFETMAIASHMSTLTLFSNTTEVKR